MQSEKWAVVRQLLARLPVFIYHRNISDFLLVSKFKTQLAVVSVIGDPRPNVAIRTCHTSSILGRRGEDDNYIISGRICINSSNASLLELF
jgi:hypothetical protein